MTSEIPDEDPNTMDNGSDNEDEATKAAKRRERLEQNRISARESRKRKKNMIEELQRTVITLSRENKELNERNEALRRELVEIGTKNPGVVNIQALMSCSGGGPAEGGAAGGGAAVPGEDGEAIDAALAAAADGTETDPIAVPETNGAANPQEIQQTQQPIAQVPQVAQQALVAPTPAQQQAAAAQAAGINPQQLAMMQQMMALQQAGMMAAAQQNPGMMAGMMGMPGAGAAPGAPGAAGVIPGLAQTQPTAQGGAPVAGQQPPASEAPK